jgi:DNA invertase Pin-like site-specific DNA recombinase
MRMGKIVFAALASGRPIAASDAQQIAVRKMRKAGASLRKIARDTSLGLQTVRTILGQPAGKDRTLKRK